MGNDTKLGLFAGIAMVLIVAVFFQQRSPVGTVAINDRAISIDHEAPPAKESEANKNTQASTWKTEQPRESQPVSRDPLLWP